MSTENITRGFLTESVNTMSKMGFDPYANYSATCSIVKSCSSK